MRFTSFCVIMERLRRVDWGFVVVIAICFVAVWPLLSRPGLPQETDAELHIFRLAELARVVAGGELYPRWAPNFYYGYGYPIFNYYAPLSYYLGLPLALIPSLGAVAGIKFVLILNLLAAGWGMYGFVRDNWGTPAGLVSSAVYVYAPYIHYVDPHARGDVAEAISFGIFPLALWALDRVRRGSGRGAWVAACLAVSAIILAHNLMAMVFFGLLLGWVVWQMLVDERSWQQAFRLFSPLGLGMGLAAFFWLPVVLERDAVNLLTVIGEGSHFDFRNHFLTLGQLFGGSQWLDWGATESAFSFNLGLAQWILGGLGFVLLIVGGVKAREQASFFAIASIGLIAMMLPISTFVWERVPLLPFLQFPWRLLGATVAMLAVLAGVGVECFGVWLSSKWKWGNPAGIFITLTILLALPLTQLPPWPGDFGDTSARRVVEIELAGRWLGTTSTADFVPATVDVIPKPQDAVLQGFWDGTELEHINRASLPQVAIVEGGEVTPLFFRYTSDAPQEYRLRLFLFDFPGWEARIDGAVVETELGKPEGFLVVPVPAGEHTIEIEFTETPARQLAWGISGGSLLILLILAVIYRGDRGSGIGDRMAFSNKALRPIVAGVVVVSLAHIVVFEPLGWLHFHSMDGVAIPAGTDTAIEFENGITLIGYDAPESARPGETIHVTLYWQTNTELDTNYQNFVHVLWPDNNIIVQSDKLNPGDFPTDRWPTNKYVRDEHHLTIPEGVPAGEYRLTTGLWLQTEGRRIPVLDDNGNQISDNHVLLNLTITD